MSWPTDLTRPALAQLALVAAMLVGSGSIWYVVIKGWLRRTPTVPLARRRPVPWLGRDVLVVVFITWALQLTAMLAVRPAAENHAAKQAPIRGHETDHPAEQLLRTGGPGKIALVIILAVIIAPAVEEFLFRLLLQGWLEAVWTRQRKKHAELRTAPVSAIPLVLPAVLFAMMHFRKGSEPQSTDFIIRAFLGQMAANVAAVCVAVGLLRKVAGATASDFGWQPQKLAVDAKLALWALAAIMPPLLVLQMDMKFAFEQLHLNLAPDPIPLFFLALIFGYLYQRTHRITPSLLLHAAFNATSIALFFMGPK